MWLEGIQLQQIHTASLQTTNRELHTAWNVIRRLYPNLDPFSSGAIELRFCGFDAL